MNTHTIELIRELVALLINFGVGFSVWIILAIAFIDMPRAQIPLMYILGFPILCITAWVTVGSQLNILAGIAGAVTFCAVTGTLSEWYEWCKLQLAKLSHRTGTDQAIPTIRLNKKTLTLLGASMCLTGATIGAVAVSSVWATGAGIAVWAVVVAASVAAIVLSRAENCDLSDFWAVIGGAAMTCAWTAGMGTIAYAWAANLAWDVPVAIVVAAIGGTAFGLGLRIIIKQIESHNLATDLPVND